MLVKTLLNQMEKFKGFVFGKIGLREEGDRSTLVIEILPRKGSFPECPVCGRKRPTHDTSRKGAGIRHHAPVGPFC